MVQHSEASQVPLPRRKTLKIAPLGGKSRNWETSLEKPANWDVAKVKTESMLDRVDYRIRNEPSEMDSTLAELLSVLWELKSTNHSEVWENVISQCLRHPVRDLIHQDPFAHRCYTKPRGYAGDAVLIDYLYTRNCHSAESEPVTALGERIWQFMREVPASEAVRTRRDMMAGIIDEVCKSNKSPSILSVACGHLREAALSEAVMSGATSRFVALDQDKLSLATVEEAVASVGVTTVHNSIKALFRGPVSAEKFDLIYSTGLYDYLDDAIATKLTKRMFEMLNPGGRLVVANYMSDLACSAYMEAFLDWNLIYRDVRQMRALASAIPQEQIANCNAYIEPNKSVAFLDILRH
jgi:extracellular factor (EF) 3-hydroxypalmitic acid methyl ester biosynthesis protein